MRNGGGSGSAVVYANDSIYLPAKNTMSYNSVQDTAIVAENSKIGSLNPNIPQLLPPVHHHIWVEILDAYFLLMAVVLDIVSGGSGTPFLVAMIEQVAVAVVTNLETQAVNMIGGVQHKFNGTSLALSAVEAAISAGAGEVSKLQAGPNMIHYKFGAQLAISESFEALRQVAAIGFGAQHHFNWAGFVASALGASTGGIMHKAHLSKAEGYALQTASAGVQVVIEGLGTKSHRVDPFTVGATMLGTAIGTAIASPSASPRADINTTNKSANGNLSRSMPTTHQDESPLELAYDAGEQGPVDLKKLHTESTSPAVHQAKNDARMHGTYLDQVQQSEINAFRHLMWSHSQDIMTHLDAMSLDMLGARMSVGGFLGVSASVASAPHTGFFHELGVATKALAGDIEDHVLARLHRLSTEPPQTFVHDLTSMPNKAPSPIQTMRAEYAGVKHDITTIEGVIKQFSALKGEAASRYAGKELGEGLYHTAQQAVFFVGSTKGEDEFLAAFPENDSIIGHIFRNEKGHIIDTPKNRDIILSVARDPKSYVGSDKYGNTWHAQVRADGKQVWVLSRKGVIRDAGINDIPKEYNPETGFSNLIKPRQS